jgi:hypothetical protein
MISTNKINLKQNDKVQKKFIQNIKLVLQKIGTSHKTRALHSLAEKEMLYIGYGTVDISGKRSVAYGVNYLSGTKLSGLCADIGSIVDKADLSEVAKKVKDIEVANRELSRVKSTITDTSTMQINNLDKQVNKNFEDLLDAIDYFALVDVYYYLYINALSSIGLKGKGKNKIFETTYDVIKEAINKILRNNKTDVSYENSVKKDIILDYIFARKFTDQSAQTTLAKLSKIYGENKLEFLVEIKPQQYEEFSNIATLLTKAGVVNITESAFISNLRTVAGEDIVDAMSGTFDELVAYLISISYKSSTFNAGMINKESQDRLEELVSNFKKDITLN